MKNFLKLILITAILGTGYYYRGDIMTFYKQQINVFIPCSSPITYSLGDFDGRFQLSKKEFLKDMSTSEGKWEKSANKELFQHVETGGTITVNLTYDERQAATDELKALGIKIDKTQVSYNNLKDRYDTLSQGFDAEKKKLQSDVDELKSKQEDYEKAIAYWNSQGGAPEETYTELEIQRKEINDEVSSLNTRQTTINKRAKTINALVVSINSLIGDLNLNVEKFNTTRIANGEEFDEGEYVSDTDGKRINIYQFSNDQKLIRVLTHELGHALGIKHVEDKEAIMYRLNEGKTEELTESDINELKAVCDLK